MNIQTHNTPNPKVSKEQALMESFQKNRTLEGFLMESGNTQENRELFESLSLFESFHNDQRFTFSNGMFIPGLGSRAKGRLSLNDLAKKAKDANEFVESVNESITKSMLDFELTESDKTNLITSYNNHQELHS